MFDVIIIMILPTKLRLLRLRLRDTDAIIIIIIITILTTFSLLTTHSQCFMVIIVRILIIYCLCH